jgi:hypothetical protein
VRNEASRYLEHLDRLARETVDTAGGPFPERAHVNVLTFTFGWAFAESLLRWSRWAETEVEKWSDVKPSPHRSRWALRIFGEASELGAKDRPAGGVPWEAA